MLEATDLLRKFEPFEHAPYAWRGVFAEALPCTICDVFPEADQFKLPRGFMNRGLNVG
jgi:hypothetical protein